MNVRCRKGAAAFSLEGARRGRQSRGMYSGFRRVAKAIVPVPLHRRVRPLGSLWDALRVRQIVAFERARGLVRRHPRSHGLPGELILSLTSHAPRFPTLHRTLASLLRQTVKPDRLVLWLAEAERDRLPQKVRALCRQGLEIRFGHDLRSYKKLIPALVQFPDAFIAAADDDVAYPSDWLGTLVASFDPAAPSILCRRAHRLAMAGGAVAPYRAWEKDVQDDRARAPSADLIPTGVGGVLYPPGALHPDVVDASLFTRLCPDADDFWFYWMGQRAGSRVRKVGGRFRYVDWPGSQAIALHPANLEGGYDRQIRALVEAFGLPSGLA